MHNARTLTAIDLVIIVAYLAGVLLVGGWFARRQDSTSRYFFGGRHMSWLAISASIVATETSTITFISVPGIAYARGGDFRFLQLVFGYILGRIVISVLFIPKYFEGKLATVYELLQARFGGKVRALAASLFITTRTVGDGVRLLLTAVVLAAVYRAFIPQGDPELAMIWSVIILGAVMIAFTFAGGIEAVVWIEVAQLGIYIAGALAAGWVVATDIPGGLQQAIAIGRDAGKFRIFDFALDAGRTYGFWAGLLGGCFLTMSTHGTDQFMVQRYLCTDSRKHAAWALLLSGAVILVQFTGFLFIGVLLFAHYRPDIQAGYATGHAAAPFAGGDQVFPAFITTHLPSGISGLVVAAIFAAAMSSSLSAIASTAIADLYAPVARRRDDRHFLKVSKAIVVVAGAAQILFALLLRDSERNALDTALGIAALVNGPILGVFLLGAAKRGGPAAALIGMLGGLAAVLPLRFATDVAWPWYAVVGSLTTLGVGLVVATMKDER